jgi:orotate phosphoribosyltransferase
VKGHFALHSGRTVDRYFDKFMFESDPVLLRAVAELLIPLIPSDTEVLAGLELGGVPISTALSMLTGLPQVLVRKETKRYGTAKLVEGLDIAGRRLLVVEDVITTGGQVVISTQRMRVRRAAISSVLCVVDRRLEPDGPSDELAVAEISVLSLFTLADFAELGV